MGGTFPAADLVRNIEFFKSGLYKFYISDTISARSVGWVELTKTDTFVARNFSLTGA